MLTNHMLTKNTASEEHGTKTPEIIEEKKAEAEETSGSQGAFNEETGEINWDCPVRCRP